MTYPLTHDDPARLGGYRLVARLGSGGMGTVYLGRTPGGRTVALKTMHAEFAAEPEFRTRFRLETDAARVIGGEYGAQVVDADPLAEIPWLATEYVLGPPLDEAVSRCGVLPEETVRMLGARLCAALAQLHGSGVVHRDLKPSNILIAATGPKIIDFGIARASGDDRLTRTGTAAGTPAFMSPEQSTGGEHGPAGDVFALAGVLVFATTAHGPFGTGQAADLLYRVRYAEADLAGVPQGMRSVLERCFAKDSTVRPTVPQLAQLLASGAGGFAESLPDAVHTEILRHASAVWDIRYSRSNPPEQDLTGPDAAPDRRWRPTRRQLVLGGGALAACVIGTATWTWPEREGGDRKPSSALTGRPPGTAPKAQWKRTFSGGGEYPLLLVGETVTTGTDAGLVSLAVRSGGHGGTNRVALDQSFPVTDGTNMHGIDTDNRAIASINPGNAQFSGRVASLEDDLRLPNPTLLAEYQGLIFAVGAERSADGQEVMRHLAVEVATGEVKWRREIATAAAKAVVVARSAGVLVFAMPNAARVWGISTLSGKTLWSREFPGVNPGLSVTVAQSGSSEYLFVGINVISALRIADGKIVWRFGKDRDVSKRKGIAPFFYGSPVSADGVVYAIERDRGVVALDEGTGELIWELASDWATDAAHTAMPAAGSRCVYFPIDRARWFVAVDCERRREAWTFLGPEERGFARVAAARSEQKLIVAKGGTVLSIPLE